MREQVVVRMAVKTCHVYTVETQPNNNRNNEKVACSEATSIRRSEQFLSIFARLFADNSSTVKEEADDAVTDANVLAQDVSLHAFFRGKEHQNDAGHGPMHATNATHIQPETSHGAQTW